jgi:hypothetical protein
LQRAFVPVVFLLDGVGDHPRGMGRGTVDRGEHVSICFLNLHAAPQVHDNPTELSRVVTMFFGIGEMDGYTADVVAKATQLEAQSKLHVGAQGLGHLDVMRLNLNLHIVLHCSCSDLQTSSAKLVCAPAHVENMRKYALEESGIPLYVTMPHSCP